MCTGVYAQKNKTSYNIRSLPRCVFVLLAVFVPPSVTRRHEVRSLRKLVRNISTSLGPFQTYRDP